MAILIDNGDEMHVNEYPGTMMIPQPLTFRLCDIRMPDLSFIRRYHHSDEMPPDLTDSIILDLLEELARLKCNSNAAPPDGAHFKGFAPGTNAADARIDDAITCSRPSSIPNDAPPSGSR